MMQVKEVRELNNEQLAEKLVELKKDLFNLRLQLATNQLDNPVKIKETKKAIARVQTVLRERELNAEA